MLFRCTGDTVIPNTGADLNADGLVDEEGLEEIQDYWPAAADAHPKRPQRPIVSRRCPSDAHRRPMSTPNGVSTTRRKRPQDAPVILESQHFGDASLWFILLV